VLARRWGVPQVVLYDSCPSTLDVVHELGAGGAPHGTTVVAEEQTAGRGRDGRSWRSPVGGVWLSVLLRASQAEFATLAIRTGLVVADVIDEFLAAPRTALKWPNDVLLDRRKLAGVLCEGRWQGDALQWLALGVGVNVLNEIPPELAQQAVALREYLPELSRVAVLDRLVPAVLAVVGGGPTLAEGEQHAFAARDWLRDRMLSGPIAGRARGIRADGSLMVERDGTLAVVRDGHVELS
jgi:BirA family transcriptional regulator, biotin operon repressor / biotin---[acetyl-CoA-carboxylase] ligase